MGRGLVSTAVLGLGWRSDRVAASCRRNFVHNRRSGLRDEETGPFTALVWLPRDLSPVHLSLIHIFLHDVVLTFHADLAGSLRSSHGTSLDQIVV